MSNPISYIKRPHTLPIYDMSNATLTCLDIIHIESTINNIQHYTNALVLCRNAESIPNTSTPCMLIAQWYQTPDGITHFSLFPYETEHDRKDRDNYSKHLVRTNLYTPPKPWELNICLHEDSAPIPNSLDTAAQDIHRRINESSTINRQHPNIVQHIRCAAQHYLSQLNQQHNTNIPACYWYNSYLFENSEDLLNCIIEAQVNGNLTESEVTYYTTYGKLHIPNLPRNVTSLIDTTTLDYIFATRKFERGEESAYNMPIMNKYIIYPINNLIIYIDPNAQANDSQHEQMHQLRAAQYLLKNMTYTPLK